MQLQAGKEMGTEEGLRRLDTGKTEDLETAASILSKARRKWVQDVHISAPDLRQLLSTLLYGKPVSSRFITRQR